MAKGRVCGGNGQVMHVIRVSRDMSDLDYRHPKPFRCVITPRWKEANLLFQSQ